MAHHSPLTTHHSPLTAHTPLSAPKNPLPQIIHWALPWPSRTSRVMALKRRRSFKFRLGDGNLLDFTLKSWASCSLLYLHYMLFSVTIGRPSRIYGSRCCKVLSLGVFHLGTSVIKEAPQTLSLPLRVVLPVQWHLPASRTSIPGQCCHYLELFPNIS